MSDIITQKIEEKLEEIHQTFPFLVNVMNLGTGSAAKVIGVSEGTLRNWTKESTGPIFKKMGSRTIYSKKDVATWLCEDLVKTA